MPHEPGHPPERPRVTRRSAFEAFTDDVRQELEGNPIFEALNVVSNLVNLGNLAPVPPSAGAAGGARFLANQRKLKSFNFGTLDDHARKAVEEFAEQNARGNPITKAFQEQSGIVVPPLDATLPVLEELRDRVIR